MGALSGLRVVEVASLGPGPFCAMVLADHGANVLRIERPGGSDVAMTRNRQVVSADLKTERGVRFVMELVARCDVLIEGFRPGVAERLGIGPEACSAVNPALVYGRMTGWGQSGELAATAGHDINYIATSGVLGSIGRAGQPPTPPLNLVGDFGGGGLLLAFGVLAAVLERQRSGKGQVVDAAMVDGSALLSTAIHELAAAGSWAGERGHNILDSGAPFYDVYETSDSGWLAVGAIEPQFFSQLVEVTEIEFDVGSQYDTASWPQLRDALTTAFASRTRDEWQSVFGGSDACVSPVLELGEAAQYPVNVERQVFVDVGGVAMPAPAPRFSRTHSPEMRPGRPADLADWGFSANEITELKSAGIC